ncbi:MAG: protein kinase [Deltaproteobacteria bacterium]|nr:protein kinase [Deltaproteobacteria bacterium]
MLGVGGMGKVVLMRDVWLGRDVAVKEPGDTADRARFVREALVTARLEHPGIVPVYDLGTGPSGEPWFAMRVVRGRSLASILADEVDPDGRRALLRAFHAAVEAVAYAHRSGVVHRDLKPQNIMIGQFGEAQVIDWGLAQTADLPEPDPLPGDRPVGTPRYMSPEQRRSEPVDPRTDVYALGLILAEMIGAELHVGGPEDAAALGPWRQTCGFPRCASRDLRAIVRRATAAAPADRYPDAKALADDLGRFLDGRRVKAHAYSGVELLARFVRARRVPLLVALVAVFVLVGGGIVAYDAIATARERAAHSVATSQLDEASRALERGALGEAGALAADALTQIAAAREPTEATYQIAATARGVLGSIGELPVRERLGVVPCEPIDVHDRRVLCAEADRVVMLEGGRRAWQRVGRWSAAAFTDDGGMVVMLIDHELVRVDAGSGATLGARYPQRFRPPIVVAGDSVVARTTDQTNVRFDRHGWEALAESACPPDAVSALGLDAEGEHLASVCNDGTLHVAHLVDGTIETEPSGIRGLPTGPLPAAVVFVAPHIVLLGDSNGGLYEVLLGGDEGPRRLWLDTGITRRILVSRDRRFALVIGDRSGPALVDLGAWEVRARFRSEHVKAGWFGPDGRLVTAGRELLAWDLGALGPTHVSLGSGVTGLAMSPDGGLLAVANANRLTIVDTESRLGIASWTWPRGIVKVLSFRPDGSLIAQGLGGGPIRRFAPPAELSPLPDESDQRYRRLVPLADGSSLVTTWGPGVVRLHPDGRHEDVSGLDVIDLVASPDGRRVAALTTDHGLWIGGLPEREPLSRVGVARGGVAVAARDDGRLAVATAHDVRSFVWGEGAPRVVHRAPSSEIVAVATTPGWVAAGARDGSTFLWAEHEEHPRASFPSHRDRVENLAFDPRGRWLVAGAWDGRVSMFDLRALELSAEAVEAAWGVSAADVMPAAGPLDD